MKRHLFVGATILIRRAIDPAATSRRPPAAGPNSFRSSEKANFTKMLNGRRRPSLPPNSSHAGVESPTSTLNRKPLHKYLIRLKFGWCHAADTNSVAERRRRLPLRENICKREAPRLTESRTTKELKWAPPSPGAAFYTPPPFVIRRRECPGSRRDEQITRTPSAQLHDSRLYYYYLIFVAISGLDSDTCIHNRTSCVKKLLPSILY